MQEPLPARPDTPKAPHSKFPLFIMDAIAIIEGMIKSVTANRELIRFYKFKTKDPDFVKCIDLLNFVINRSMKTVSESPLDWKIVFTDAKTDVEEKKGHLKFQPRMIDSASSNVRVWFFPTMKIDVHKASVIEVLQDAKEQLLPYVDCFTTAAQSYIDVENKQVEFYLPSFGRDLIQYYLKLNSYLERHILFGAQEGDNVEVTIPRNTFSHLFARLPRKNFVAFLDDCHAHMEVFKQQAQKSQTHMLTYKMDGLMADKNALQERRYFCSAIPSMEKEHSMVFREAKILGRIKNLPFMKTSNGQKIISFCSNRETTEWDNGIVRFHHVSDDGKLSYHLLTRLDPAQHRALLVREMDDMILNIAYLKSLIRSNTYLNWQEETKEGCRLFKYIGSVNIVPVIKLLIEVLRQNGDELGSIVSGIVITSDPDTLRLAGEAVNFFFGTPNPVLKAPKIETSTPVEVFKAKAKVKFINDIFAICAKYRTRETSVVIDEIEESLDVAVPKNTFSLYCNDPNSGLNKAGAKLATLRNELQMVLLKYQLYRLVPKSLTKARQEGMQGFEVLLGKLLQALSEKENLPELTAFIEELDAFIKRQDTPKTLALIQEFRRTFVSLYQSVQPSQECSAKLELRANHP